MTTTSTSLNSAFQDVAELLRPGTVESYPEKELNVLILFYAGKNGEAFTRRQYDHLGEIANWQGMTRHEVDQIITNYLKPAFEVYESKCNCYELQMGFSS